MKTNPHTTRIKPYNLKELCELYNINPKTMKKWLEPHADAIGQKTGRLYNTKQVRIIFDKLGLPGTAED